MKGSRKTSTAYTFVDMLMASSNSEKSEQQERKETESHETQERKRSILQKFVAAIFDDEENNSGHNKSQAGTEESTKNPESEDTKTRMVSEVQHLNRDRKKSLLVHVFDEILFRLQHNEQELPIGSTEDQGSVGDADDKYITGENDWRQEEIDNVPNEDKCKTHNSVDFVEGKHDETVTDREDQTEDIAETSDWKRRRQRKHGIVVIPNGKKHGLPNLGFEQDRNDDAESGKLGNTSVREPKKSVTFSVPEFPEMPSMNEKRRQELNRDELAHEKTSLDGSTQNYLKQHCTDDNRIESSEGGINSSPSKDNPDVPGFSVSSAIFPSEKKRPKRIKDWLKDLNLYKVSFSALKFFSFLF